MVGNISFGNICETLTTGRLSFPFFNKALLLLFKDMDFTYCLKTLQPQISNLGTKNKIGDERIQCQNRGIPRACL